MIRTLSAGIVCILSLAGLHAITGAENPKPGVCVPSVTKVGVQDGRVVSVTFKVADGIKPGVYKWLAVRDGEIVLGEPARPNPNPNESCTLELKIVNGVGTFACKKWGCSTTCNINSVDPPRPGGVTFYECACDDRP